MNQDKAEDIFPLVQKSFSLCVELYAHVNRFPRAHKSLLGRDLLSAAQQMLIGLNRATFRHNRFDVLEEVDFHLDTVRLLVRLSHRLNFLSHKAYETLSQELLEIGRMLGGWIKANTGKGGLEKDELKKDEEKASQKHPKSLPAVRYTMKSPKIEEYLKVKLEHPKEIVLVKTGAFYKSFFEDALYLNKALHLKATNLAAESEQERIPSCGFPITALEKFRIQLASLGRVFHVSE